MWLSFGLRLRDERLRKKWSVADLAEKAGVSRSNAYAAESGTEISSQSAVRLASALGLRIELLVTDPRKREQRPNLSADPVHSLMGEVEARHFRPIADGIGLDEPYQHFQFAGRADFVAWRLKPITAMLHIENRTRFPDFQEMAGSFNAKRAYLGNALAARLRITRWDSETHVIAALWSAEVLHALRLRTESFKSLTAGEANFAAWWSGEVPTSSSSELVILDPLASAKQRVWVALGDSVSVRPRYTGYAQVARKIAE